MKKILFIIFLSTITFNYAYADTHDVKAKYEKIYNVELSNITLNDDTQEMTLGESLLEFSTTQKHIKVVVIKVENEENNYVKSFTNNNENYYIGFYKEEKKLTTSNIKIKIKNANNVLSIFDNNGNIVEVSDETIYLNNNNYFMTITNKIENNNENYRIIDVNSFLEDLENIELNNNSTVNIYNYKNILMDNNKPLGTGSKVIINNSEIIKEYKIVVKGDTTGDAKINLNDITRLYHYYKKIEQMDEPFVIAGDVAKNDIINLNDITKIYHFYKNIIPKL